MTSRWFRYVGAIAFCSVVVGLLSCARDQELVSMTIQPSTETFGAANIPVSANAGSTVQLRALGTYIHPPVTKDVTAQATWASNTPDIATVDASGLLTATGLACGNSLISATIKTGQSSGSIVTANMTANVVCFVGPVLTVNFAGNGTGTITSSPTGLSCASTCSTSFPSNITVVLTATANGTFGGWSGCDSVNGTACTVAIGSSNRSLIVTFN
jgi:hypothetical protein